jgi:UDP:flavonoid glycosyltransferase YjiC (YdhE family)
VGWTETEIDLQTGRPFIEQLRPAVYEVLRDRKFKDNTLKLQKEMAQYDTRNLFTDAVNSLLL